VKAEIKVQETAAEVQHRDSRTRTSRSLPPPHEKKVRRIYIMAFFLRGSLYTGGHLVRICDFPVVNA
jgi:hypothetical protein